MGGGRDIACQVAREGWDAVRYANVRVPEKGLAGLLPWEEAWPLNVATYGCRALVGTRYSAPVAPGRRPALSRTESLSAQERRPVPHRSQPALVAPSLF